MTKPKELKALDGCIVPHDYRIISGRVEMDLLMEGVAVTKMLWQHPHILEVKCKTLTDYKNAIDIMRLECPTECSSLFGMSSRNLLVFQFDQV